MANRARISRRRRDGVLRAPALLCVRVYVCRLPARALEGPVVGEFDAATRRYMAKERQLEWR